jgi:hypothetical protein
MACTELPRGACVSVPCASALSSHPIETRRSMIRNCTDTTVSCSYRVFVIYSYTVQPYADPMPHAAGAARPDPALEVGWELDRTDRNTQTAKLILNTMKQGT